MTRTKKDEAAQIADLTDAQIVAQIDQITAEVFDLADQIGDLNRESAELKHRRMDLERTQEKLTGEMLRRSAPFKVGDIVADDQGVRYRVHHVYLQSGWSSNTPHARRVEAGQVWGIRLTKTGNEAYSAPRLIVSSRPLEKVEV